MKNIIECQFKITHGVKRFKVDDDTCNHELLVCESCPKVDSKNPKCLKCYGVVAVDIVKTGERRTQIYRDSYSLNRTNKIQEHYDASNFLKTVNKLYEMPEYEYSNFNLGAWYYSDRPQNYKTVCSMCKEKYGSLDKLTPCRDKNIVIINDELYEHYCPEQKQTTCKFY